MQPTMEGKKLRERTNISFVRFKGEVNSLRAERKEGAGDLFFYNKKKELLPPRVDGSCSFVKNRVLPNRNAGLEWTRKKNFPTLSGVAVLKERVLVEHASLHLKGGYCAESRQYGRKGVR